MMTVKEASTLAVFLNQLLAHWLVRSEGQRINVYHVDNPSECAHTFVTMWDVVKWVFPMINDHYM